MPERIGPLGLTEEETRALAQHEPYDTATPTRRAINKLLHACRDVVRDWDNTA